MPDDRLEREINEILNKIEQLPKPESHRARARRRIMRQLAHAVANAQRAVARQMSRISIGQVMLLSSMIILGSFFFRRFSPLLMQWALVAGVVLFVSSFAILAFTRGGSTQHGYWRGHEISAHSPSLFMRLRRWFSSRRHRRT